MSCLEIFKLLFHRKNKVIRPKTRKWMTVDDSDDEEIYYHCDARKDQ